MKSYLKTAFFAIVIFGIVGYFIGGKTALDFVSNPVLLLALGVLFIAILLNGNTSRMLQEVRNEKRSEEERIKVKTSKVDWYQKLMQLLTKSKPIAEESTILMNHEYDGIRELDNDLPPWWVYLFYISIIVGFGYMGYYHLLGGDTQIDELNQELAQAKIEIAKYKETAKDLVDASTVVLLTEKTDLSKGEIIFKTSCIACHLADGGGSIGPNLTDEYWILGGGIKNVFHTITEGGREGKGMIPWGANFKPSQIQQVASYVLSLKGTTPIKAKAPEGDVWVEE